MAGEEQDVPLNAIRAFVAIAREKSVTRAAKELGITQSSVSRYLAVLEEYLGTELLKGRGRGSELTDFGRQARAEANRIVVRTSLSTFAYTLVIPHLPAFSAETGGAVVDVMSSLSLPSPSDGFDVLITRDLALVEHAVTRKMPARRTRNCHRRPHPRRTSQGRAGVRRRQPSCSRSLFSSLALVTA